MKQEHGVESTKSEQDELFDKSINRGLYLNLDIFNEYVKNVNLRSDPEFIAYTKENTWETRRDRNFPWRMDVFDYLREVYGPWLGNGLTRSDIKAVDEPLYWRLYNELQKTPLPSDIDLPTGAEATLNSITDADEKEHLLKKRELWKQISKLQRHPPQPT